MVAVPCDQHCVAGQKRAAVRQVQDRAAREMAADPGSETPGKRPAVSPRQNSMQGSRSTTHSLSASCTSTGQLNIRLQVTIAL